MSDAKAPHLYRSSQNGSLESYKGFVIFCQHCGRVAFDGAEQMRDRIDKLQREAGQACPLAPEGTKTPA